MPQSIAIDQYKKQFPYCIRIATGNKDCERATQWCFANMGADSRFSWPRGGQPGKHNWAACVENYDMNKKLFFFCDEAKAIEFRLLFG